jgi:hypothetical protein
MQPLRPALPRRQRLPRWPVTSLINSVTHRQLLKNGRRGNSPLRATEMQKLNVASDTVGRVAD